MNFSLFFAPKVYAYTNPLIYRSQVLINKANANPISTARFYRDGILFDNQGRLFFNDETIKLINSFNGPLKINNIITEENDFYLASDIGVFKNFRRIFSKEECFHIEKLKKQIYISCRSGIYQSKINPKLEQEEYNWRILESSPREANYFSLNKSKNNVEFASSSFGFFYYNPHNKKWQNRSYGINRDFQDSFGFGRFHIEAESKKIILPTSSGLFISEDQAKTWIKHSQGLKPDPNGFFSLRAIKKFNGKYFLASSNGLYVANPRHSILSWKKITLENSKKDSNANDNLFSIDSKDNYLIISNSQGQIFKIQEDHKEYSQAKENKKKIFQLLSIEPKIQDLHKVALEFAGIPTGKNFSKYRRQARLRNLIPNFEAFLERDNEDILSIETQANDDFSSSTSSLNTGFEETNLNRDDNQINSGIRFTWRLSNLFYDPEINDINTSARITANVRENILTELTQIYYNRKELLVKIFKSKLEAVAHGDFQGNLKLEEYTAQLDARTGSWFSEELAKNIQNNKLESNLKNIINEIYLNS